MFELNFISRMEPEKDIIAMLLFLLASALTFTEGVQGNSDI